MIPSGQELYFDYGMNGRSVKTTSDPDNKYNPDWDWLLIPIFIGGEIILKYMIL